MRACTAHPASAIRRHSSLEAFFAVSITASVHTTMPEKKQAQRCALRDGLLPCSTATSPGSRSAEAVFAARFFCLPQPRVAPPCAFSCKGRVMFLASIKTIPTSIVCHKPVFVTFRLMRSSPSRNPSNRTPSADSVRLAERQLLGWRKPEVSSRGRTREIGNPKTCATHRANS